MLSRIAGATARGGCAKTGAAAAARGDSPAAAASADDAAAARCGMAGQVLAQPAGTLGARLPRTVPDCAARSAAPG